MLGARTGRFLSTANESPGEADGLTGTRRARPLCRIEADGVNGYPIPLNTSAIISKQIELDRAREARSLCSAHPPYTPSLKTPHARTRPVSSDPFGEGIIRQTVPGRGSHPGRDFSAVSMPISAPGANPGQFQTRPAALQ